MRLDLPAIDACLRAVQNEFGRINRNLSPRRDMMSDEVRENLMAGYRFVDHLLAQGVDLFELGNSRCLLELNTLVLCGTNKQRRKEYAQHIMATEKRFYEQHGGGIRALTEWLQRHKGIDVWRRAAAAYIHILSPPELFIEGNHRTGVLIMSYMLGRKGLPPFVLSDDNAKAFFDNSNLATEVRKRSIGMFIRLPKLKRRIASLLKNEAKESYLVASS